MEPHALTVQKQARVVGVAAWLSKAQRSLRKQLVTRFVAVFVVVTLVGSAMALLAYQEHVRSDQARGADIALEHVLQRFETQKETWRRYAEEVKLQIDFMRIFAGPSNERNGLRLQAYFAAMEGKLERFPSGLVLDGDDRVLFEYGSDAQALSHSIGINKSIPPWFRSRESRTVYMVLTVPLWLGAQGSGQLVLLQPLNNGLLYRLDAPHQRLFLALDGEVVASSEGTADVGSSLPASVSGRIHVDGRPYEQRVQAVVSGGDRSPLFVLQKEVRQELSALEVIGVSAALLTTLIAVLWLVVGRWATKIAKRSEHLVQAVELFAEEHAVTESVQAALKAAQAKPDEISAVAAASRELMESVIAHDREHFGHLQTLDMLEEGVVELAPDGRYLRASPGWARLADIDLSRAERIFDHIHLEDAENLRRQFAQLSNGDKGSLSGRMRLKRSDDKELWVEYRFICQAGASSPCEGVRGVLRDITQSYLLEKHVTHMALHDALTGLPNRVLLEDRCSMALRSAERNGEIVALGFLDVDHFKHVNDQFGHKTGDELLVALSASMRGCLRSGDTLARWGGDEFVVLLTELGNLADAEDAISKLVAVCQTPIRIGDTEFNATFSMGVALYPSDATSVDTLLSQADRAMFAAKQQGRNTARFYAEIAKKEEDHKALYIQNRLATAIREGKIQAWFQPIVDARTRKVVSCEALARWQDETYGWISPATFVPMAENLGLIREMGKQVWLQAIENLHRWRERGLDMRMSVNVSRRQLFTATFTGDLLEDLDRLAIPVAVVDLEITESVAMEDAEHTEKRLAELTEAGFGIAIDDFGTGYSSLSQLHDMPATKIKIDISFVRRAHEAQGRQLIQAIVKIASAFGLQTVAEGVESADIADVLTTQGVTLLQGYHFGKPMDAASFDQYLLDNLKSRAG